ncbi:hypothetical protein GCM10008959_25820 [Deinococcus seoulensis]|uniref:Uncharacterized protein n=1 Tax=Deinococcus seoulensis TaxID=1837379 RepID=A0ABQ2RVC7_9DEIO|nr:hypothetical protein [Deinococcus seoulensis]GGR62625.1 hypothetical protein GCM10008959_25820 [Deinococcus seoulensis]
MTAAHYRADWVVTGPQRLTRLEEYQGRYWVVFIAELHADPCTPERAHLSLRAARLARLARRALELERSN